MSSSRPPCCRARPRCASCRRLLQQRQLFPGKVDGNYSADLRTAIEAYEKAEGLAVTGLATLTILKRLGGSGTAPGERPKAPRKAKS